MKLSTRKYAKRQVSWIRNKLLPAVFVAGGSTAASVEVDEGEVRGGEEREVKMRAYVLDATGTPVVRFPKPSQSSVSSY